MRYRGNIIGKYLVVRRIKYKLIFAFPTTEIPFIPFIRPKLNTIELCEYYLDTKPSTVIEIPASFRNTPTLFRY